MISVAKTFSGFILQWQDRPIQIKCDNLQQQKGALIGDIHIVMTDSKKYHPHVYKGRFNFSSIRTKSELIKTCLSVVKDQDWSSIIEQFRVKIMDLFKRGEPAVLIDAKDNDDAKIEYLIYPLIPKNCLTIAFGEGGTGKSTFALILIALLQNSIGINGLDVNTTKKTLFLDYETERHIVSYRWRQLVKEGQFLYRRCSIPLLDDISNIFEIVKENDVETVIIDSIGVAAQGDLNDASTANAIALALRQLNCTSIAIAHTSKGLEGQKTIYGSVFFWNNARSVIEVRREHSDKEDVQYIGLFHRKANYSRLSEPIILKLTYNNSSIFTISSASISETESLQKLLPLPQQIQEILRRHDADINTLKEELEGVSINTIKVTLSRLKRKGLITNLGHKWRLIEPF